MATNKVLFAQAAQKYIDMLRNKLVVKIIESIKAIS
jgi:hypothetical protein